MTVLTLPATLEVIKMAESPNHNERAGSQSAFKCCYEQTRCGLARVKRVPALPELDW